MKEKVSVVTGGMGFLGSHLCDSYIRDGYRVICVDNQLTGNPANIAHLKSNPKFELVEADVSCGIQIPGEVDNVLHFASPASPIDYLNYPIQTLKVGSLGTHNALGLAKAKKARFLLASTSEIYGDPLIHPQKEDYWGNVNPIGPRGVYDEAKRFAEAIAMAYHRVHQVDVKIVRIFNTYGPRMRLNDGRAIPAFVKAVFNDEKIPVFGDGSQTRSFCYVDDLIAGLRALIGSELNEPVNIGNPNEMTILQLAEKIIAMTHSKSVIDFKELPEDDPKVRKPDITKAKTLLNWEPKVPLETGLEATIQYFRESLAERT